MTARHLNCLILREKHKLSTGENGDERNLCPNREEKVGRWTKFYSEKIHNVCFSINTGGAKKCIHILRDVTYVLLFEVAMCSRTSAQKIALIK